jgi:hypothetical protein
MAIDPEIRKRLIGLQSSYEEPYPVQVRGESSYKDNIENICGYVDDDGYDDDSHKAFLYFENENKHDPGNAIRIEINDLAVGYLSRPDAKLFRERLKTIGTPENPIAVCGASIKGGFLKSDGETADYGVRLDFDIDTFTLAPLNFTENVTKEINQAPTAPVISPKINAINQPKRKKTSIITLIVLISVAIFSGIGLLAALISRDNSNMAISFAFLVGSIFLFWMAIRGNRK